VNVLGIRCASAQDWLGTPPELSPLMLHEQSGWRLRYWVGIQHLGMMMLDLEVVVEVLCQGLSCPTYKM
jgi:hypothetical protein